MDLRLSHFTGCLGFWLWAFVGAVAIFGFISLGFLAVIPAVGVAYFVQRRPEWRDGPVLHGLLTGLGLPLLVVAALHWSSWHQRTAGDNTPNPYYWGAVGLCFVIAGIAAYAIKARRA